MTQFFDSYPGGSFSPVTDDDDYTSNFANHDFSCEEDDYFSSSYSSDKNVTEVSPSAIHLDTILLSEDESFPSPTSTVFSFENDEESRFIFDECTWSPSNPLNEDCKISDTSQTDIPMIPKEVKRRRRTRKNVVKKILSKKKKISKNIRSRKYRGKYVVKIKYPAVKSTTSSGKVQVLSRRSIKTLKDMKKEPRYQKARDDSKDELIESERMSLKILTGSKVDRYYSRINIKELSRILGLDHFQLSLTAKLESIILQMFEQWCGFKLGFETWVRDTTKDQRTQYLDNLHGYTSEWYPEITKDQLEIIIRRGTYCAMQSRLRKFRRSNVQKD
ncbi:hypothetical protein CAAN1_06S04874 [[Candida] anglica]|uniref:Uncharacterized protein n=1 Tax=[Candida] anglica TaxID=148631 RepID=A0ABP0EL55_9ASCO